MKKFFWTACVAVVIMMCAVENANAQKVSDEEILWVQVAVFNQQTPSTSSMKGLFDFKVSTPKPEDLLYASRKNGRLKVDNSYGLQQTDTGLSFSYLSVVTIDNNTVVLTLKAKNGINVVESYAYPKEKLVPTQGQLTAVRSNNTDVWEPAKVIKTANGGIKIKSIVKGSPVERDLTAEQLKKLSTAKDFTALIQSGKFPFR